MSADLRPLVGRRRRRKRALVRRCLPARATARGHDGGCAEEPRLRGLRGERGDRQGKLQLWRLRALRAQKRGTDEPAPRIAVARASASAPRRRGGCRPLPCPIASNIGPEVDEPALGERREDPDRPAAPHAEDRHGMAPSEGEKPGGDRVRRRPDRCRTRVAEQHLRVAPNRDDVGQRHGPRGEERVAGEEGGERVGRSGDRRSSGQRRHDRPRLPDIADRDAQRRRRRVEHELATERRTGHCQRWWIRAARAERQVERVAVAHLADQPGPRCRQPVIGVDGSAEDEPSIRHGAIGWQLVLLDRPADERPDVSAEVLGQRVEPSIRLDDQVEPSDAFERAVGPARSAVGHRAERPDLAPERRGLRVNELAPRPGPRRRSPPTSPRQVHAEPGPEASGRGRAGPHRPCARGPGCASPAPPDRAPPRWSRRAPPPAQHAVRAMRAIPWPRPEGSALGKTDASAASRNSSPSACLHGNFRLGQEHLNAGPAKSTIVWYGDAPDPDTGPRPPDRCGPWRSTSAGSQAPLLPARRPDQARSSGPGPAWGWRARTGSPSFLIVAAV